MTEPLRGTWVFTPTEDATKPPCVLARLCPKCGGDMNLLRYVPAALPGCRHDEEPGETEIVTDEHLHRLCCRCGYVSWEPCWSSWVREAGDTVYLGQDG